MKKSLVVMLTLIFILGIAGTALAANPFSDVPAGHWAYSAVNKLATAGIVDGMGDGTFKGDKTLTRYEMATFVARAMAKEDKATAEQKALINKLAQEFAGELQGLGVRVQRL
ncbi:MAG: S-layer protein, partial [Firmicutes bacterium]|nr:S-layer protein [Bacillota bacterium]